MVKEQKQVEQFHAMLKGTDESPVPIEKKTTKKPAVKKKLRKIAVVGTAESISEAPYADKDWEIWGLGVDLTYPQFKRWDRLYEMHDKEYYTKPEIVERLNKANCTVYMQKHVDEIPLSVEYPLEEVSKGYHKNFTSSIAFQLAHAALEARELGDIIHVALFGVHMMADDEYGHQRPACEYWLGVLEGLGVSTHVAGNGSILKCNFVYGYDKEWKILSDLVVRRQMLDNGLTELEKKVEDIKANYEQQRGVIKDVEWMIRRIQ